jgi:hypothetical protein
MTHVDSDRLKTLSNDLAEAVYALRMIEDGKRDELKAAAVPIFMASSPRVMTLLYDGSRTEILDYAHALSLALRDGASGRHPLPATADEVLDARAAHWCEVEEQARKARRQHLSVVGSVEP